METCPSNEKTVQLKMDSVMYQSQHILSLVIFILFLYPCKRRLFHFFVISCRGDFIWYNDGCGNCTPWNGFSKAGHIRQANLSACSLSCAKKQTRSYWEAGHTLCYSSNKCQNTIHHLEPLHTLWLMSFYKVAKWWRMRGLFSCFL